MTEQIAVKVIERSKRTSLVEWLDGDGVLQRVTVPNGKIKAGQCGENTLNAGIPYGLDVAALDLPSLDVEALTAELHRQGVWTTEDFVSSLHLVRAAISRSYLNPLLTQLVEKIKGGKL